MGLGWARKAVAKGQCHQGYMHHRGLLKFIPSGELYQQVEKLFRLSQLRGGEVGVLIQ